VVLQGTEPRKFQLSQGQTRQKADSEVSTGAKETCHKKTSTLPLLSNWTLASYRNVAGKFAGLHYPSHVLHREEVMLRQGISTQQVNTAYLRAKDMLSMKSPEKKTVTSEVEVRHDTTLTLYAEHKELRRNVTCRRGQSRNAAAKFRIFTQHQELDADVRHNYFKIGPRLEKLQQQTSTRFSLFAYGAFADWYRSHQNS
jgi:hypothetical protein